MKRRLTFVLAAALACLAGAGRWAPGQPLPLEATVEKDKNGRPVRLVVNGEAPADAFLGRSFYPKGTTNALKEGIHDVVPVPRGRFSDACPVPASAVGGTWEVALWRFKIEKKNCQARPACAFCRQLGYHLDQCLAYKGGRVGPEVSARLETEVTTDAKGLRFLITGEVKNGEAWVGSSLYTKDVKDPVAEGSHEAVLVHGKPIDLSYPVDAAFAGGTYEVAVWQTKVARADCKVPGCVWCKKLGYHLEGQLAYKGGALAPTLATALDLRLSYDATGTPVALVMSGKVKGGRAWLGRSLYPPGVKDALKEGEHEVLEISDREFNETAPILADLVGGAYEVALWRSKVPKAECTIPDCRFCARLGFHLDGLLVYKDGKISAQAK